MMKFRTEIEVPRSAFTVSHSCRGFIVGSCFSEHISRKLTEAKFLVESNPTGILFNPRSIGQMMERLANDKPYQESDLRYDGALWFSYHHHGAFSDVDKDKTLLQISNAFTRGVEALRVSDYVIITFGTAWLYKLVDGGGVVANCHKQPSSVFIRERLSVEEIVAQYDALLRGVLVGKQVLFTVSPVRHLKDGFAENSLSKSILRVVIAQLEERFPGQVFYFPSFEIMNDDLRDYRFYADDMVHPSSSGVDYIWDKFCSFAMDKQTQLLLPKLMRLNAALEHRVFNEQSLATSKFRSASLALVEDLAKELPGADFSLERAYFK